ncbi:Minor extracellular protease vpr [Paramyrothecium foliicola]|nr:Minor extracellular protease vpr [Paramyrothecium foliicola]
MNLLATTLLLLVAPYYGASSGIHHFRQGLEARDLEALMPRKFIVEYSHDVSNGQCLQIGDVSGIAVVKSFNSQVFCGAAIQTNDYSAEDLLQFSPISRVWENQNVYLPTTPELRLSNIDDAPFISPHAATGVDRLHDQGIKGKGAKVGIIDTGIAYTHEALGGGFGRGYKVEGGFDFVGDELWPIKNPDADPIDSIGWGTRTAGIIAGNYRGWVGVAPDATLHAYKVFSRDGRTSEDIVIEAFLAAYDDGVDVITTTYEQPGGFSSALAEVASRLVREGIVVTMGAGDNGAYGAFYSSRGSSARNVLAVASVVTPTLAAVPFAATVGNQTKRLGYLPERGNSPFPITVTDWPIVSLSLDTEVAAEGCIPYPSGTRNLSHTIPLVKRGGCGDDVKSQHLTDLGARYILIYNDDGPLSAPDVNNVDSDSAIITAETGNAFIEALRAGLHVSANFLVDTKIPVGLENPNGIHPSTITSWGPLHNLNMKPDIAAPGENVFTTTVGGGYGVAGDSGLAAAYVAGIAALFISAHGGRNVRGKSIGQELTHRIISSGKTVRWSSDTDDDSGYTANPAQVGNGLVDAWKVVKSNMVLGFENLALNDTRHFRRSHKIVITNNDKTSVTYKFSQQPAAGFDGLRWDQERETLTNRRFPQLVPKDYAVNVVLPADITVQPGRSRTVNIDFANPDQLGWNATAWPLYGGKIFVDGSNREQASLSYLGLGADLKNGHSIVESNYPRCISSGGIPFAMKSSYSFNLTALDFPEIILKLMYSTHEIRWDIFEAGFSDRSWSYPPVPGQNGFIGSAATWANSAFWFDPNWHDHTDTNPFPRYDVDRNLNHRNFLGAETQYFWFGKLSNGSQIERGNYTFRFAVLKPFGIPTRADNWDVYRPTSGLSQFEVTGKY